MGVKDKVRSFTVGAKSCAKKIFFCPYREEFPDILQQFTGVNVSGKIITLKEKLQDNKVFISVGKYTTNGEIQC